MNVPIIRPALSFNEVADDLAAIVNSGQLTSGPYLASFEDAVAAAVGVDFAIATTSATTALHLALAALGIGPGDEVLVSDFTFPASGNVIVSVGATPVLVDCRADGFDLDVDDAAAKVTARTRAIMPVHPFGQPADIPAITALAESKGLLVIEDAACALGSTRGGVPCGSEHPGAFSFHPRKVVTTGEGGAITTHDAALADRLRLLRSHGGRTRGSSAVGLEFVDVGFNYRLPEISAALGVAQLRRLDEILADRARTAAVYETLLVDVDGVTVRTPAAGCTWSYQSFVVMVDETIDRDLVVASLRRSGIETTLGTYAMHAQPAFARFGYRPGDLPHSDRAQRQSLTLPLVPQMTEGEVRQVMDAITAALGEVRARGR